jgi:hypothetical protein
VWVFKNNLYYLFVVYRRLSLCYENLSIKFIGLIENFKYPSTNDWRILFGYFLQINKVNFH